ncbi:hypothetical protein B0H16DRAFT_1747773 [Mycena metata]|uniref:Uncharacterized protein n=1 Tax=Mycena metata TaxID=1033252 RepID=A0AAD7GRS9_9AGAR|nr:hypothetical protein B0H16DRAFT_1747773 [Mycena metata]
MLPQVLHLERAVSQIPLRLRVSLPPPGYLPTPDLQRLLRAAAELSQTFYISSLPVFFPNLDPRGIPNAEQLDSNLSSADPVLCRIINAICAFSYLSTLHPIPPEATQLIWNRIQPWIHFLHTYWTCISPVVAPYSELDLHRVSL